MGRPTRGSRLHEFYSELDSTSLTAIDGQAPSALDSAFHLQEYISALVRVDPHNVERIIKLPLKDADDGEVDEACWVYEHLRRLALDLTYPLVDMLQNTCNRRTCPEMKAGEWLYLCVAHGSAGAMEQCCAIDYIVHTIDSATALLNSPRAFPSRLTIPASSRRHFPSLARRLGRIFAHAYFHHREGFAAAEAQNSLYARFLALCKRFDLVPQEFLVIPLPQDEHAEAANSNVVENGHDRQHPQSTSISPDAPNITILSRSDDNMKPRANTDEHSPASSTSHSRSPRNRLRTDTMYLSGTFHEVNPNFSSASGGNGGDMDTRRVPSPLAATLASQEEEDEKAALTQNTAQNTKPAAEDTTKDSDEAQIILLTPPSVPVIVSNAAPKILIRDFALEHSLSPSVSTFESPSDIVTMPESDSDDVTTTTIPVPVTNMVIPPIVVNAPEVVISPAEDDDSTSPFLGHGEHVHVITEVSLEDEDEENPDVDDLEHALENDEEEEEEEEEEEVEGEINVDAEWPESDITSASAIEVRFEEIAPEPERRQEEDQEQHELERATELDPSSTVSAFEDASIEGEQPLEPETNESQDTAAITAAITSDEKASDPIANVDADDHSADTQDRDSEHDDSVVEVLEALEATEPIADDEPESKVEESQHLDAEPVSNTSPIASEPIQSQPTSTDGSASEQLINEPLFAASTSPDDASSNSDAPTSGEEKTEKESEASSSAETKTSEELESES